MIKKFPCLILLFIPLVIAKSSLALAYPADVFSIPTEKYFDTVISEVRGAEKSVVVSMYQASIYEREPKSRPFLILKEIVAAKERGVDVWVLLDQNIDYTDGVPRSKWKGRGRNQAAYEFLKENGIDVFYDDPKEYTHAKAVIVDEETVILGSTNWTKASLSRNNEANVLIRSPELAEELIAQLKSIKSYDPAFKNIPTIRISWELFNRVNLVGAMVTSQDERAFDVYLYLLKQFDGKAGSEITLNYDELAQSLGIQDMDRVAYRRQISKVLKKLDEEYNLIELETAFNKPATITLKGYEDPKQPYAEPKSHYFQLPETYWTYGWNQKLSFAAKVVYMLNLSYSWSAGSTPWWSLSREVLSERHHLSEWFFSKGTQELRRLNLIEVQYESFEGSKDAPQVIAKYMPNNIYDPKVLEQTIEDLKSQYSQEVITHVRKVAESVMKENDSGVLKFLAELEMEHGSNALDEAVQIIEQKQISNPKRSIGYLIGIIKGQGVN